MKRINITKASGIYMIRHIPTASFYIGSSVNISQRISQHVSALRANRHSNNRIQALWVLNGGEEFSAEVLEFCSKDELVAKEQQWLDMSLQMDIDMLLNLRADAINKPPGVEAWNKGRPWDSATKERLRQANLGKTYSAETNAKKAWRGGPRGPMSEEQKAKVSASKKGRKLNYTPEAMASRQAKAWESRRAAGTDKHSEATKSRMAAIRSANPTKPSMPVVFRGQTMTLGDIATTLGISYSTAYWRYRHGKL